MYSIVDDFKPNSLALLSSFATLAFQQSSAGISNSPFYSEEALHDLGKFCHVSFLRMYLIECICINAYISDGLSIVILLKKKLITYNETVIQEYHSPILE